MDFYGRYENVLDSCSVSLLVFPMVLNKVGISDSCFQTIQKLECTCRTETQMTVHRREKRWVFCWSDAMEYAPVLANDQCLELDSTELAMIPHLQLCGCSWNRCFFGLYCQWRAAVQHSRLLTQAVPGGVPPLSPLVTALMSGRRGA